MSNIIIKENNPKFEVNSAVKSVTIFSDRAEVTRTMKTTINKGTNSITFLNLGNNIDSNTIRAKVNNKNVKIISNMIENNILYFFREKENQIIFEELITELKNYIILEDENFVCKLENDIIYDLRDYIQLSLNELILDSDNTLTKLKEALTFLEQRINSNSISMITINNSQKLLKEKLDNYKYKLEKIRTMDKRVQNNITVTIDSPKETEIELEIYYNLSGVVWRPTYDASLDIDKKIVSMSYFGEISQTTGENWENCNFILSTAIIDTDIDIPRIYPVSLSGYSEKRDKNIKVQQEVYREMAKVDEFEEEDNDEEDKPQTELKISTQTKGISCSFVIEKPSTIVSDGKFHKLLIAKADFKPELFYETIPEIMEFVYQKATLKNNLRLPFLPGTIMIYRNASYMGKSQLKYTAPEENFSLSFGIDDDIRIKRIINLNRYIEPTNIFAKKQREFKYTFVSNNFKNIEVSLKIVEPIHKSSIKEITVDIAEDTTKGYELNDEGILSWEIKLPPDPYKPIETTLHYTISSGKSFPLENI